MKLTRIPTRNLSEQEWQDVRKELTTRGMVGGSDASTLLGLNQYKSPINMFYQAVGLVDQPNKMNSAMLHGKQLEDYVAKCWQYWDGDESWVNNTNSGNKIKKYRKVKAIIINPKYPALFANIDGRITQHPHRKDPGILEVKTMSGYSADMWEAGIPPGYYAQIQHYMLVTGLKWGELVYLKDGRELGVVKFDEDRDMQRRILEAANEFKERVEMAYAAIKNARSPEEAMQLASNYEPRADNTDAFSKFISEKHKARQDEVHIHGGIELAKWMDEYREASEAIKEQELRKTLASNTLRQHMEKEGATAMTLPNGKITWRSKFTVKYE